MGKKIWIRKDVYELAEEMARREGKTVEEVVVKALEQNMETLKKKSG